MCESYGDNGHSQMQNLVSYKEYIFRQAWLPSFYQNLVLYKKSAKTVMSVFWPKEAKPWFTYISQTKSCDFVEPARSCDTDVLREDDSQLCSLII